MTTPGASEYPALITALNQSFTQAGEAVKILVDTFNEGIRNVNTNPLIYLAPDFLSGLGDALDRLRDYVDKFCKAMIEFFRHQAPIIALIQTAFDWLTRLREPVSSLSGTVTKSEVPDLRSWTGNAALYYFNEVAPPQGRAVSATGAKAAAISKWLMTIAQANVEFMLKYAEKITELSAKFLSALISASTIVGALEAIGKASDVAADMIKNAATIFADSMKFYTSAIGYMREAEDIQSDNDGFPKRLWPKPRR